MYLEMPTLARGLFFFNSLFQRVEGEWGGYKKFGRDGMGGKIKNEAGSLKVMEKLFQCFLIQWSVIESVSH